MNFFQQQDLLSLNIVNVDIMYLSKDCSVFIAYETC